MKKLLSFLKKEVVLSVAFLLAAISTIYIFVTTDNFGLNSLSQFASSVFTDYIDWHTILLLFSLMSVMAGLQALGLFKRLGTTLLSKIKSTRQMLMILIFLPFLLSMLITNDVALITFVPFGLIVLKLSKHEKLLIPLVVLQTVAANLGSMLTPMGNPQNLYLYAQSKMSALDFLRLMLPYTIVSALCILIAIFLIKSQPTEKMDFVSDNSSETGKKGLLNNNVLTLCYLAGFIVCLLCVADILPAGITALICMIFLLVFDRDILKKIDYSLLGTFVCFFIFIGNMGEIEIFCSLIEGLLEGNEKIVAILASQIISNVPAALLLSGFSNNWNALIIGTNLGGLGTLIASMASLISYKQLAAEYPNQKGRYLMWFTITNVIFLVILFLFDLM